MKRKLKLRKEVKMVVLFETLRQCTEEVTSSNIKAIGYAPIIPSGKLIVIMKNSPNVAYYYHNVPMFVYDNFMNSDSKGKFFINEIKSKFKFERIEQGKETW